MLTNNDSNLTALTGLRAIAATWVVLFHYHETIQAWLPFAWIIQPFARTGFLGVDLFFALSGFVIAHRYLDSLGARFSLPKTRKFVSLRLARLLPTHLFVLVAYGLYIYVVSSVGKREPRPDRFELSFLPQQFLMVHAWFNQAPQWNSPAWSVSLEWMAYLCFPVLALLLWRATRGSTPILAALVIFLAAYSPLIVQGLHSLALGNPGEGRVGINIIRILGGFLGGAAMLVLARELEGIERWRKVIQSPTARWAWGILILITILAISSLPPDGSGVPKYGIAGAYTSYCWLITPLLAVSILIASLIEFDQGKSILNNKFLVLGGLASYSLYLTHELTFSFIGGISGGQLAYWLGVPDASHTEQGIFVAGAFLVAWLVAWAVYKLVEEPSRIWLRSRLLGKDSRLPIEERS